MYFAFSTENVDMVGRREHFLKSNFESLSGGVADEDHAAAINNSISNKYKSGAPSYVEFESSSLRKCRTPLIL